MKKNYIIAFIIITAVLITSVITVGIVANVQLKNREDDKYYKIGEVKLYSINEATNTSLKLVNHSYGSNGSVYTKYYEYEIDKAESVVSIYTEYLTTDENFEISSEEVGKRGLKKTYGNKDTLVISIQYSEKSIELALTYTYID